MHRLTNYQHLPASERVEISAALRQMQVIDRANEILSDRIALEDAVAAFCTEHSFTGLYLCLSTLAQAQYDHQYIIQAKQLQQHLKTIAHWQAERETAAVSIFHLPQAG